MPIPRPAPAGERDGTPRRRSCRRIGELTLAAARRKLRHVFYWSQEDAMTARKEAPESDVHAAQRYLESLLDSDEPLAPGEIEAIQDSIEAIRRGKMTLGEFERKHGVDG